MSSYLTIIAVVLALCFSIEMSDSSAKYDSSISICGDPGNTTFPPPQQ